MKFQDYEKEKEIIGKPKKEIRFKTNELKQLVRFKFFNMSLDLNDIEFCNESSNLVLNNQLLHDIINSSEKLEIQTICNLFIDDSVLPKSNQENQNSKIEKCNNFKFDGNLSFGATESTQDFLTVNKINHLTK